MWLAQGTQGSDISMAGTSQSQDKHSTTEPLHFQVMASLSLEINAQLRAL